ncbi:hypothetical protein BIFDEN_01790 [Bifidobacterium dentium ATCC 27678]|nr:hypothetical protein BIFDEN_01790 [Bifidobacterium dentium ATCC 27678]
MMTSWAKWCGRTARVWFFMPYARRSRGRYAQRNRLGKYD